MADMFVNGSERNEWCLWRTFHRCLLPSVGSFGQAVSEEKIQMSKSLQAEYERRTPIDDKSSHGKLPCNRSHDGT